MNSIQADSVSGRLVSDPREVANLKLGDAVDVSLAELGDWLYSDGARNVGGFSVAVLQDEGQ